MVTFQFFFSLVRLRTYQHPCMIRKDKFVGLNMNKLYIVFNVKNLYALV